MRYLIALRIWLLKYQIALCNSRRNELAGIIEREYEMIDHEEHVLNVKLRELRSQQVQSGLVKVRS